jgi:hypothetical protein
LRVALSPIWSFAGEEDRPDSLIQAFLSALGTCLGVVYAGHACNHRLLVSVGRLDGTQNR